MEIEFDFRKEASGLFGDIMRPVARVILINGKTQIPQIFYVDSGVDLTLIPLSVGELLGFKVNNLSKIDQIRGIGDQGVPMIVKRVELSLGDIKFPARIGWCLIDKVPLLLGRVDIFKLFDINFKKDKKVVFNK